MTKRERIIISVLIILIFVIGMLILNETLLGNTKANDTIENSSAQMTREVITNSTDEPGSVEVIRNIGNTDGKRIAYVVGLHPLEYQTHRTLVNLLPNMTNLSYCYDIYIINVTEDVGYYGDGSSDDSQGRQNGQNLAYRYVYPEIVNGSYELAVDVHSNVGAYPVSTFVFSPNKECQGSEYAMEVADSCENISYYAPDSTTSGPFLTMPLNENGVPAFYFEEYSFAFQDVKNEHMLELIGAIDNLKL